MSIDDALTCSVCGSDMTMEPCHACLGAGGSHECGDDVCPCLDPHEITDWCEECNGEGEYPQCSALPHSDEQMAEFHARSANEPA